jgi:hypothetical protein
LLELLGDGEQAGVDPPQRGPAGGQDEQDGAETADSRARAQARKVPVVTLLTISQARASAWNLAVPFT